MQAMISQKEWEEYRDLKTRFDEKLAQMDRQNLESIVGYLENLQKRGSSIISVEDVIEVFKGVLLRRFPEK